MICLYMSLRLLLNYKGHRVVRMVVRMVVETYVNVPGKYTCSSLVASTLRVCLGFVLVHMLYGRNCILSLLKQYNNY